MEKRMEYFRIHANYIGRTGKPVGVFGACHHLKRAGRLTPEETRLFEETDAWYIEHLPEPPFYKEGNPLKAITWFKDTPEVRMFVKRLDPLVALLRKYGIDYSISKTTEPGEIVYEDDFQVATV
jgi:hypothetical protein